MIPPEAKPVGCARSGSYLALLCGAWLVSLPSVPVFICWNTLAALYLSPCGGGGGGCGGCGDGACMLVGCGTMPVLFTGTNPGSPLGAMPVGCWPQPPICPQAPVGMLLAPVGMAPIPLVGTNWPVPCTGMSGWSRPWFAGTGASGPRIPFAFMPAPVGCAETCGCGGAFIFSSLSNSSEFGSAARLGDGSRDGSRFSLGTHASSSSFFLERSASRRSRSRSTS